jgi:hypothetical protein
MFGELTLAYEGIQLAADVDQISSPIRRTRLVVVGRAAEPESQIEPVSNDRGTC